MKPGAFVMFNDYTENGGDFEGVAIAAKEYAKSIGVELHCCIGRNNAWLQLT